MKKINKRKKAILILYTYIIMLLSPKTNTENNNQIYYNSEYNSQDNLFATYNNKYIYIVNKYKLDSIIDTNPNNIYIYDQRKKTNPDISIYDSYKINNMEDIKRILEILLEYENKYPSNWNRTLKSMENEWLIHNICYKLNIEPNRTKEVDLDNNDEEKYQHFLKILIEVLKEHYIEKNNNPKILTKSK